ncbi:MAG: hypothetical protein CSA15_08270, partial [Candidatus Delongbacteria bacterium]
MINYLKNLFGKKENEKVMDKIDLDKLWSEFHEEKFSLVENELKMLLEKSNQEPKSEVLELLGLCYFKQGDYKLAEK